MAPQWLLAAGDIVGAQTPLQAAIAERKPRKLSVRFRSKWLNPTRTQKIKRVDADATEASMSAIRIYYILSVHKYQK